MARAAARTCLVFGTICLTDLKISSFPHWIAPNPFGSRKSLCISMMMSAVVSGQNLKAYGLAEASSISIDSMLKEVSRDTAQGGVFLGSQTTRLLLKLFKGSPDSRPTQDGRRRGGRVSLICIPGRCPPKGVESGRRPSERSLVIDKVKILTFSEQHFRLRSLGGADWLLLLRRISLSTSTLELLPLIECVFDGLKTNISKVFPSMSIFY